MFVYKDDMFLWAGPNWWQKLADYQIRNMDKSDGFSSYLYALPDRLSYRNKLTLSNGVKSFRLVRAVGLEVVFKNAGG